MDETTNTPNQTPQFEGEEMKMPESAGIKNTQTRKGGVSGPVILVLGLLLLAILIGLFMWFTEMLKQTEVQTPVERPTDEENNEPESTTAEAQTDTLETVSTSDEIAAIEADIEATQLEALDAELNAIEAELDAAF